MGRTGGLTIAGPMIPSASASASAATFSPTGGDSRPMSDSAVGVVGDPAVADRLREAGAAVVEGAVDSVPATERVVAVGQPAVRAVAAADADPLVLPVAAGRGVRSVARDAVLAAVGGLETAVTERHPL